VLAVVGARGLVSAFAAGAAGSADGGPSALVFVVAGDVADRGVQADRVVFDADAFDYFAPSVETLNAILS
jgi:hypothetical protein